VPLRGSQIPPPARAPSLSSSDASSRPPPDSRYTRLNNAFGAGASYPVAPAPPTAAFAPTPAVAPTLEDLNAPQRKVFPKAEYLDRGGEDGNDDDLKRELLFKFELLKKQYDGAQIPEYTIHSDYRTMKKSYEMMVRRLGLDSTVEQYKQYLSMGFYAMEFIFGAYLGFDMRGFAAQQNVAMRSYERLLIELGEKSHVDVDSDWPVEFRLLRMMLMNTGLFILARTMAKKGHSVLGMATSAGGMGAPAMGAPTMGGMGAPPSVPRPKMRGPPTLRDIPILSPVG
jgi:hypothetical protein